MKVNLTNGADARGSYMLFIGKVDADFKSIVTYNENENYFSKKFTNEEIQKVYGDAVAQIKAHKNIATNTRPSKGPISGKLMLEQIPQPPICIDWYWTETTYDQYGNIIDYEESYLYTICYPNGGNPPGGGGGCMCAAPDPDPSCEMSMGKITSEEASQSVSETVGTESGGTRPAEYKWVFLKNAYGLWWFTSVEDGVHKKVGNEWRWESLKHRGILKDGIYVGTQVSCSIESTNPTVGTYAAGMQLTYQFNSSMICKGFPISADRSGTVGSPVWQIVQN